jgi:hypothetical protein
MKHKEYKYRLLYLLRNLTVNDYELAMKYLPILCGITKSTFREWIYRKEDEISRVHFLLDQFIVGA